MIENVLRAQYAALGMKYKEPEPDGTGPWQKYRFKIHADKAERTGSQWIEGQLIRYGQAALNDHDTLIRRPSNTSEVKHCWNDLYNVIVCIQASSKEDGMADAVGVAAAAWIDYVRKHNEEIRLRHQAGLSLSKIINPPEEPLEEPETTIGTLGITVHRKRNHGRLILDIIIAVACFALGWWIA